MHLRSFVIFFLSFTSITHYAWSQSAQTGRAALNSIAREHEKHHAQQREKARDYARRHNVPMQFADGRGNNVYLVGVDTLGLPVYITTLNAGSAITTGVPALRAGGALGIDLAGAGMTVGVWDESKVKDHAEFDTRIVSRQGSFFSAHATHVAGTILAAGINENVKGMAPLASATTWDFENDLAEMASLAAPDQSTLLLSNHSYGILLGFYKNNGAWAWAGNTEVSTEEDYRFGFYGEKSMVIDRIAFNAPYYTLVWAGGNDRSDVGDGSHPADGNQGTGYDLIGPDGGAKNVITVGAVLKVTDYTDPASVVMSGFSSWGPTDDGRIKPDLVAAGVSVSSTSVTGSGADTYSTSQGTSMAAPNVTGSLVLLQELYRGLYGGNMMKAATVKALAIHTAKEAGNNPGPDYHFGWGLLDAEAAAETLLARDQQGTTILENTLADQEVFELALAPAQGTMVTATIVWTDPPGTPVAPRLDPIDLMLVNDLDMRLTDDDGNEYFPWTLNPADPAGAATQGDNVRDNVEKVEFVVPAPGSYTLTVNHKNTLVNGQQDFSLVLTYTPADNAKTTYYRIGNSGEWHDPSKWSLASGGAPANQVPDMNSRVVIDENSFTDPGQTITLTAGAACASLTWLTKKASSLSLNNNTLRIDGNLVIFGTQFSVSTAGDIELLGETMAQNQLNLNNNDLTKARLIVNSAGGSLWTATGAMNLDELVLQQGELAARNATLQLNGLTATTASAKVLDLRDSQINGLAASSLQADNLQWYTEGTSVNLAPGGTAFIAWPGITYKGSIDTQGAAATISGGAVIHHITVSGELTLNDNNSFEEFYAQPGSVIHIQPSSVQTLTGSTVLDARPGERIAINTAGGTSVLNFSGHYKLCFDFLDIDGITVDGTATISPGTNSTLSNAANWAAGACSKALFADFTFQYGCEGALTEFTDASEGNITAWTWSFGDPSSGSNTSDKQHAGHVFAGANTYTVTLTVSDGTSSAGFSREVTIGENPLPVNQVILAGGKLFSESVASLYQWFKDGQALENETARSYEFNGAEGAYFVLTKNAGCNRPSAPFVVTDAEEVLFDERVRIFPTPATDAVHIHLPAESLPARVSLVNTLGQPVLSATLVEERSVLNTDRLGDGFYVMDISGKRAARRKVIIRR